MVDYFYIDKNNQYTLMILKFIDQPQLEAKHVHEKKSRMRTKLSTIDEVSIDNKRD